MSSDFTVNGTTYRRNGFNEWCESSPYWDPCPVDGELADCLDEIERLRAAGDAMVKAMDGPPIASQRDEARRLWQEARRG